MPAIRPSRLGICPGHAPERGLDTNFVAVARRHPNQGENAFDVEEEGSGVEDEDEELDGFVMAEAINAAHSIFTSDATNNGTTTCERLLAALLDVTESTVGFIASNACLVDDSPCLKTHAITNIMWTDRLRAWYSEHVKDGLVFTHVDEKGLFGRSALRGQAVFSNNPDSDELPKGHPRINGVASIPLICGPAIVGVAVVANRVGGYSRSLLSPLQPLLTTIANIVFAISWRIDSGRSLRKFITPINQEGTLKVHPDGRLHSLDTVAQTIFGFSPTHLWFEQQRLSQNSGGEHERKQLQLKDLFKSFEVLSSEVLDGLKRKPQVVLGYQQGGQKILLKVGLKEQGEDGNPHVASVRILMG